MVIILEVTSVTNVGIYSSRNVTSLFKSFRKTSYLGNYITRFTLCLAQDKLHSICIHSPIAGWNGTVTLTTHGSSIPLFRLFFRLPATETFIGLKQIITVNNN